MQRLKKLIYAIFALTVLLAMLTACGNTSDIASDAENNSSGIVDEPPPDAETSTTVSVDAQDVTQETDKDTGSYTEQGRILVAYFSRAGENYNVGMIEKGKKYTDHRRDDC